MGGRAEQRWRAAVHEHERAIAEFVAAAERLSSREWTTPRASGKWSPGNIAEHLALVYEALLRELAGDGPMAARAPAWRQHLLRWIFLPHILFHRSIPVRARAPRETRPPEEAADQHALLVRLRQAAERFQRRLDEARRTGGYVTHPYFGRISPVRALRFCAVHVEHHRGQISR